MKDEKVTLDTAKLLKEKNFNILVHGCYVEYNVTRIDPVEGYNKGDIEIETSYFINNDPKTDYSNSSYTMYARPTHSLVQKWLREVHNIQVYAASHTKNGDGKYRDYVAHINDKDINDARDEEFQTYEEALEVGLQVALEDMI